MGGIIDLGFKPRYYGDTPQNRINELERELVAKDAEIKQLGAELQKMERTHVSELAAKNREIEALKAEVERANNSSESYRAGIANLRDRLAQREAEIERLSAPVSDEEWMEGKLTVVYPYPDHDSTRECMLRPVIDRMIAARLEGK